MRCLLACLVVVAVLAISGRADAEPARRQTVDVAAPATSIALLGGWRTSSSSTLLRLNADERRQAEPVDREPGEELTLVVERMWSQVRAYRKPGGAQVIVRGRF